MPSQFENKSPEKQNTVDPTALQFSIDDDAAGLPAWTEIDEGRYMPRRVRGSYHGRALG